VRTGLIRERQPFGGGGPTPTRAQHRGRLVDDDAQQPRTELVAAFEPVERFVRLHEGLLGGILRLVRVTQYQEGGSECGPLVAAHQLLEGAGVAVLRGGDERFVFQVTASR